MSKRLEQAIIHQNVVVTIFDFPNSLRYLKTCGTPSLLLSSSGLGGAGPHPLQLVVIQPGFWATDILKTADDGVRCRCVHPKRSQPKVLKLNRNNDKVCKVMGLVVDQGVREDDSPGLPPYNSNSPCDSQECSDDIIRKKQSLIDITLRTMALLRRNQELQKRLTALQVETRAFVKSVLSEQGNQQQELNK